MLNVGGALVPRRNEYSRDTEVPLTFGSRKVIRTKIFASGAANFILQRAREALDNRGEFRVALSAKIA
jgi:hypothetical protein